jgi:hypothetical protein
MLSYESYMDEANSIVRTAHLAVLVSVSADNDDIEFCPLYPPVPESTFTSQEEYVRRQLRTVCVIGLCGEGATPRVALKEHLDPQVFRAIGDAFVEYAVTLIRPKVEALAAEAEVAELSRLYQVPDTRPN